ncbi:bacteriohemerythrin [Endozoicomonas ascidiicola]|uniref:bacteriohemerythrin n=1 Tax=Endozoicomonas ascidiicola TaxID=1698521 RepID=UPI0008313F09|nr:hemerythrin family protein [Endozoicomonas ascidiicola]
MNNSLYIVWSDDLNLGINIIDEQHRGLVSLINSFYYHIQMGASMVTMQSTLKTIEDYAKIHFATEEAVMAGLGFEGLDAHRISHDNLLLKTQQLLSSVKTDQDVYGVMPFLRRWWMDHIVKEDREFVDLIGNMSSDVFVENYKQQMQVMAQAEIQANEQSALH